MRRLFLFVLLFIATMPVLAPVLAWADKTSTDPAITATLVAAQTASGTNPQQRAGIYMPLPDGWKIYGEKPGPNGQATRIHWTTQTNIQTATVHWPMPDSFNVLGLHSVGYKNTVMLPVTLDIIDTAKPAQLAGTIDFIACNTVCIPYHLPLSLTLPPGTPALTPYTADIEAGFSRIPQPYNLSVAPLVTTAAHKNETAILITAAPGTRSLLLQSTGDYDFGPATLDTQTTNDPHPLFRVPYHMIGDNHAPIEILLNHKGRAYTQTITLPSATLPTPSPFAPSFLVLLGLAFMGGVILNIMPCVLPVLALKVTGLIAHGQHSAPRRAMAMTALGILLSFIVLAGAAIALRSAGLAVGWGIQFQNSYFIAIMIILLVLFALSLFNCIHLHIPQWISNRIPLLRRDDTAFSHLISGAFATILATPCTAPFLGTALGLALTQSPIHILAVFFVMGLGFALPYLLLILVPQAIHVLPRPGKWLQHVRIAMGILLCITALWFGYVLATQILPPPARAANTSAIPWQKWDETSIAYHVARGDTVLVDITASWCLTCHANKLLVLEKPAMITTLKNANVIPLQADWTSRDDSITRYLQKHQRAGVPFNIIYGPRAPQGIVLPEILTAQSINDAIARAQ